MTCFDIHTIKANGPLSGSRAAIRFDRDTKTLAVWHGDRYPKLNVGELRFDIDPKADPEKVNQCLDSLCTPAAAILEVYNMPCSIADALDVMDDIISRHGIALD